MNITYSEGLTAEEFVALANAIWPGDYDVKRVREALTRTVNITARSDSRVVGSIRLLTDGYLFATVPEILVDPAYQGRGIGRALMQQALERSPRGALFFGAQPQSVGFFERIGCTRELIGFVMRAPSATGAL